MKQPAPSITFSLWLRAIVSPPRTGVASYKCQSERGTHSLWLHTQRCPPAPSIVSLCSENASCWRTNDGRAPRERSKVLLPLHSGSQDGTVAGASRRGSSLWGYATLSQDGVRPPPGRAAPQVLLSLPALQLSWESNELLASVLTESVQEARAAVSVEGQSERLSCVALQRDQERDGWYRQCSVGVFECSVMCWLWLQFTCMATLREAARNNSLDPACLNSRRATANASFFWCKPSRLWCWKSVYPISTNDEVHCCEHGVGGRQRVMSLPVRG